MRRGGSLKEPGQPYRDVVHPSPSGDSGMPLGAVLDAISRVKDVAGVLTVREIVATVKCDRRARDGTTQRVTIDIFYGTPSFGNRYEILAKVGNKSAAGNGNSLDEAL